MDIRKLIRVALGRQLSPEGITACVHDSFSESGLSSNSARVSCSKTDAGLSVRQELIRNNEPEYIITKIYTPDGRIISHTVVDYVDKFTFEKTFSPPGALFGRTRSYDFEQS